MLTDIPVQDFKNYFEQWPKRWEHYKELQGDYFEKLYVANIYAAFKRNLKKLV
jgi:hypothetical protein